MKVGRLQPSTLANILRSLEKGQGLEDSAFPGLQKQYIPTTSDSPLYRLVTVVHPEEEQITIPRVQDRWQPVHLRSGERSQSVPSVAPLSPSVESEEPRHTQAAAPVSESILQEQKRPSTPTPKDWTRDYEHIDVDWSMQAMDVLYNASFYDYVRDERNLELSSIRLARIIKDYKPKQVAGALTWMIQGWTVENTAKLLRSVFSDWLPDLAGCVFSMISKTWPKRPQLSLCTAYLLLSEPAQSVALFVRTLTSTWERDDTVELITYLDNLLEWDEQYLKEVMTVYSCALNPQSETILLEKRKDQAEEKMVGDLYKRNLDLAAYKLAVTDARLSLAEYRLNLLSHWTGCECCQSGKACDDIKKIPVPHCEGQNQEHLAGDLAQMYLDEFQNADSISNDSFDLQEPLKTKQETLSRSNSHLLD
ncbi:hypothetical protein EDD86DRAFT_208528, partial [Gorgonomyces haynaldii]